jgi:hypothetical protein
MASCLSQTGPHSGLFVCDLLGGGGDGAQVHGVAFGAVHPWPVPLSPYIQQYIYIFIFSRSSVAKG